METILCIMGEKESYSRREDTLETAWSYCEVGSPREGESQRDKKIQITVFSESKEDPHPGKYRKSIEKMALHGPYRQMGS